jgi:hypothetical protein
LFITKKNSRIELFVSAISGMIQCSNQANFYPALVTEDVRELTVFRATGNNLPFLGLRLNDTFQVIFIESNFGDIYKH